MNKDFFNEYNGVLSDRKIKEAIEKGDIYIAPFDESQLQPAGYNLTPTRFFYSTKKKKFLTIVENSDEVYVMIDKNDTVLVRTRESVAVSSVLSGAFYSKVKVVSEGFGHVSTTLDPNWEGQLLISLNNPTNRKLKFSIEKKVYGKVIYNSFVTLEFTGLDSIPLERSDNPPGRLDILDSTIDKNISTFKRNQVEELRLLLRKLHRCEEQTIETLIIKRLTHEEQRVRTEIFAIQDAREFEDSWNRFLEEKRKKYLRFLREDFNTNALKSIEIIDQYINRKQKYLPIRTKIWMFCGRHKFRIVGILLVIGIIIFMCFSALFQNVNLKVTAEDFSTLVDEHSQGILYTVLSSCALYIIVPIIKDIFIDSK